MSRSACVVLKLNRTLGEPHALARRQQPRKTLLAFLIWRGEISFEKGKGVFLSGLPSSIRAVRGASIRTRFCQNYFWGKGFGKTSAVFPPAGGSGENAGGFRAGVFISATEFHASETGVPLLLAVI